MAGKPRTTALGVQSAGTAFLSVTGHAVLRPAAIEVPWADLNDAAQSMADESNRHAASFREAADAWAGVRIHYSEPETQELLWSAFDHVPDASDEWARVWGLAARTLQDFVLAGRPLQQRADDLAVQAVQLEGQFSTSALLSGAGDQDSAADEFLRRKIQQHNQAVVQLNQAWQTLQSETEQELAALESHGGLEESVPTAYADGGSGAAPGVGPTYSGGRLSFNVGTASAATFASGAATLSPGFAPGFALATVLSTLQQDPVEKAEDLYEAATSPDYAVEDVGDFYDHLTTMSAEEIKDFAGANPQVNRGNLPTPSSQEELDGWPDGAEWWHEQLDEEQQETLTAFLPMITGNTEGVPYSTRHQANDAALSELLRSTSTPEEHMEYLENIEEALIGDDVSDGERLLLSLNVGVTGVDEHPPLASVSVGNPDDAEQTVFNSPGMNSGTDQMTMVHEPGEVEHAQDVYDELVADAAVVAWVGYHAPQSDTTPKKESVLRSDSADAGSWAFAHALDGHRATTAADGNPDARLDVMAHSYGTNMSIHALTRTAHDVDSFISFGSSGYPDGLVEDNDLTDLHVKETGDGHPAVYATDGFWDWTSNVGRGLLSQNSFNPADPDSGAYIFDSDGTGQYSDGSQIRGNGVSGHGRHDGDEDGTGYLDDDAQAFITMMEILNGQHDRIDWIAEPEDEGQWDPEHSYLWRRWDRSSIRQDLEELLPWSEESE